MLLEGRYRPHSTTFAILSAANVTSTRVGTVLATAAMIHDIVGLVMVRLISFLSGTVDAETIVRPSSMSIGFLIIYVSLFNLQKEITETTVVRPIESVDEGD